MEIFNDDISTFDWWRKQVWKTFNLNEVSRYTYDEAGFLRVNLPKLKKILESNKKPMTKIPKLMFHMKNYVKLSSVKMWKGFSGNRIVKAEMQRSSL